VGHVRSYDRNQPRFWGFQQQRWAKSWIREIDLYSLDPWFSYTHDDPMYLDGKLGVPLLPSRERLASVLFILLQVRDSPMVQSKGRDFQRKGYLLYLAIIPRVSRILPVGWNHRSGA
jgi:hypothetical protein